MQKITLAWIFDNTLGVNNSIDHIVCNKDFIVSIVNDTIVIVLKSLSL